MKSVKISISLPEDLQKFAEKSAERLARERGGSPKLSGYIRELLARERRQMKQAA